jgi:hypothetical protein
MSYREVFKAREPEPSEVFYTLTREDVGRTVIVSEVGPIYLNQVIGRVLDGDVGIRLYRIGSGTGWNWTAENRKQRDERLRAEKKLKKTTERETP